MKFTKETNQQGISYPGVQIDWERKKSDFQRNRWSDRTGLLLWIQEKKMIRLYDAHFALVNIPNYTQQVKRD